MSRKVSIKSEGDELTSYRCYRNLRADGRCESGPLSEVVTCFGPDTSRVTSRVISSLHETLVRVDERCTTVEHIRNGRNEEYKVNRPLLERSHGPGCLTFG